MAHVHFDDYDPTTVDQGGLPEPGKCQLLVSEVKEVEDAENPYVQVTHEIVAHENPTQVGKMSYNIFGLTGKGSRRALLFALACKITDKNAFAQARAQGTSIEIDYAQTYGSVYFSTLEASEYQGKKKCRGEWDFKALDDPEAKEYPCSSSFPRPAPPKEEAAKSTTKPASKPPTAKKAPPSATPPATPPVSDSSVPF